MPIMFNSLLVEAGVEPNTVRLVRHHTNAANVIRSPYRLWRENVAAFEQYQNVQGQDRFEVGRKVASFVRSPAGETLFVGLYDVTALGVAPEGFLDPVTGANLEGYHLYEMEICEQLSEFRGRLSIEWGLGALAWVQLAHRQNKAVREIRIAFQDEPYPGHFLFRCRLSDVSSLPSVWIERLREAKGVYVLTSADSGEHYVGSAAGTGGFHQRWLQHAAIGGAAVGLQAHAAPDYQVAILQVAAGFESEADIVRIENEWMRKIQSRTMGLNRQPQTALPPEGVEQT
ncbi:GIY-YIG nuclease family protein [Methylobacterium goesingense]|uniref:GIY-YIG domain-containing protein n=1 Tax=Methylobacterium goesingense TaxID=243690 RepID=A0ABV2L060_9HYPH|nr:GIY-YIG nuclease family protein [Methylobacterium goesingense]GJD75661.1 hypothetical protein CFIICLFH_3903 [Methylobacterium goesingense]